MPARRKSASTKSPIAATQYALSPDDLALVLQLVRGGTLAEASRRLGRDHSTTFRAIKRLEQQLGLALFARTRTGMRPADLALELAAHAEAIEQRMAQAHELLAGGEAQLRGTLRISTTDTILHGLLLPVLDAFAMRYPSLELELVATNQLANLSRRDADVAVRATRKPPEHLVGTELGTITASLYASERYLKGRKANAPESFDWIAPDDSLAEHPSVAWRRAQFPDVVPRVRCNSILGVADAVKAGLGVGIAPDFLMRGVAGVRALQSRIAALDIGLWALAHPDVRHLRRVKALFEFLKERVEP